MEKKPFRLHYKHRQELQRLVREAKQPARIHRRAQALLLMDRGKTRTEVEQLSGVSVSTLGRLKRRYRDKGLAALEEGKRSGRPCKLSEFERKGLIALACSEPPAGHGRWTFKLLAEQAKTRERLSEWSVRLLLHAEGVKPWREKNVVCSGVG